MLKRFRQLERFRGIGISFGTALFGGILFSVLHLPIPWLLGPMVAVLIGSMIWKEKYQWSGSFRNTGMIVVGYTIGLSMTTTALRGMAHDLPLMLLMTLLLLLLCAGLAFAVSKLSGCDYKTTLMGCVPGGLSQMIILAEETEGVDLTVVTVTQIVRLMMIIICVPLLIFGPVLGMEHSNRSLAEAAAASAWSGVFPQLPIFAAVCVAAALLANRIKFPTAFLLGPAFATALVQFCGLSGPALPPLLLNAAQFMIGTYVGLLLKPGKLTNKWRTLALAVSSALMLIAGALGLSILLTQLQPVSVPTALLSLSPGGMDQMGIIAGEIGADLAVVSGYQLFRTFFIFFLIPPFFKLVFKYGSSRKAAKPVG